MLEYKGDVDFLTLPKEVPEQWWERRLPNLQHSAIAIKLF